MKTKTRRADPRVKGARGEREAAAVLVAKGWKAKRDGQQGAGGTNHHDLATNYPFHVECKRDEAFSCMKRAMAQAEKDAAGVKPPSVMHKVNHGRWIISFYVDDIDPYMDFLK